MFPAELISNSKNGITLEFLDYIARIQLLLMSFKNSCYPQANETTEKGNFTDTSSLQF